jgi:hypothetical protein
VRGSFTVPAGRPRSPRPARDLRVVVPAVTVIVLAHPPYVPAPSGGVPGYLPGCLREEGYEPDGVRRFALVPLVLPDGAAGPGREGGRRARGSVRTAPGRFRPDVGRCPARGGAALPADLALRPPVRAWGLSGGSPHARWSGPPSVGLARPPRERDAGRARPPGMCSGQARTGARPSASWWTHGPAGTPVVAPLTPRRRRVVLSPCPAFRQRPHRHPRDTWTHVRPVPPSPKRPDTRGGQALSGCTRSVLDLYSMS